MHADLLHATAALYLWKTISIKRIVTLLLSCPSIDLFLRRVNLCLPDWDAVLSTNVKGSALVTKHCVLAMVAGPTAPLNPAAAPSVEQLLQPPAPPADLAAGNAGAIVNIASISAFVGQPAIVPYAATKAAILQMTRNVALDCGKHGIR